MFNIKKNDLLSKQQDLGMYACLNLYKKNITDINEWKNFRSMNKT